MEKFCSCQNHKKNVMMRLLPDFTKIIKKGFLIEKHSREKCEETENEVKNKFFPTAIIMLLCYSCLVHEYFCLK